MSKLSYIHSNSIISESGSALYLNTDDRDIVLVINLKDNPTGVSPSITFTIAEVDPGDKTTIIGKSITGSSLNVIGSQILELSLARVGCVKVSWNIGGNSPSFSQVYTTLISRSLSVVSGVDSDGSEYPITVKGPSVPALVTDPSLVVSLSPNSSIIKPDVNGVIPTVLQPVATNLYSPNYVQFWQVPYGIVKASPGNVFAFKVNFASGNTAVYLQLFDQIINPIVGANCFDEFNITVGNQTILGRDYFSQSGLYFSSGIAFAWSTTRRTRTTPTGTYPDLSIAYI